MTTTTTTTTTTTSPFSPAQVRAQPHQYLYLPTTLQCKQEYAAAALLGLTSDLEDDPSLDARINLLKLPLVLRDVKKNCPNALADVSLFRELLVAGDAGMIRLLTCAFSSEHLISNVPWDCDLALLAIGKSPFVYLHLPSKLKKDNEELAFATINGSKTAVFEEDNDLKTIMRQVGLDCSGLFSNATAMKWLLSTGSKEEFVMTVLASFCDKIDWDQDLVDMALSQYPASYSYFPACFRNDDIEAQFVMASLLMLNQAKLSYKETVEYVSAVFCAFPDFFSDPDALQQAFLQADAFVVCGIVASISNRLPWNRALTRLASTQCCDMEYHEENPTLADEEIESVYKTSGCKYHLPLGMLLPCFLADNIEVWPVFLNNCCCALVCDDLVLQNALNFIEPMLLKSEVTPELFSWIQGLVDPVKSKFQNMVSFQTLLKCIALADGGEGPLSQFPRDTETSKALIQMIADFLGAPINATELAQDALQLVYCLLTLPEEFDNGVDSPLEVLRYKECYMLRDQDTFYCKWCCNALIRLKEKYDNKDNNNADGNDDTLADDED
jgi:hypothetical protein